VKSTRVWKQIVAANPVSEETRRMIERLVFPETARWRYFQTGAGPMFFWNTEPIRTRYGGAADGKYDSGVVVPYGPGSKSGTASRWKVDPESVFAHVLRRDAKARALRLFNEWKETQQ